MERALYISKYRNIGFEKDERIVLNNSLEKGKMGNLVILVGANNSGKSNVLAALNSFNKKQITDRDLTTLSYEDDDQKPTLSLCAKDGEKEFYHRIGYKMSPSCGYSGIQKLDFNYIENLDLIIRFLKELNSEYRYHNNQVSQLLDKAIESLSKPNLDDHQIDEILKKCFSWYDIPYNTRIENILNEMLNLDLYIPLKKIILNNSFFDPIKKVNEEYNKLYGMSFIPKIINYVEKTINNNDTMVTYSEISNSNFFRIVFKKIGMSIKELESVYNAFKKQKNSGVFETFENKVNKKLKKVADDFNKLYYEENDKYAFKIRLEKDMVYFNIYRGTKDIVLDYQSTGFRWFFNIYFNLLTEAKLESGDIIVMDEPATNLHVNGQRELRVFLKKFAIENDLTIVIATHSPFLIDLDYLDELRVISNKDNAASICNDFTTVDLDDPDSLKPIKNALTVYNHVLLDYEKDVVFVEGITDYNYLLTFKNILKINKEIVFLPIKGVGKSTKEDFKNQQINISKSLIRIKKYNPILLTDSDKAGIEMQKLNSKDSELNVITLKDIDEKFKFIEDLFSIEDLTKLGLINSKGKTVKSSSFSSIIKTFYDKYEFSSETLNNFKKVFDYLASL